MGRSKDGSSHDKWGRCWELGRGCQPSSRLRPRADASLSWPTDTTQTVPEDKDNDLIPPLELCIRTR